MRSYDRPETTWTSEGERVETGGTEEVVTVYDPRGWTWEVVLTDDHSEIDWLGVSGRIDQNALRTIPLGYLREVAADYLRKVELKHEDGFALWAARLESEVDPGDFSKRGDPPTPEEFAAQWNATPKATFVNSERVTRRAALAERYNVTVYAIDKWTRQARDAGLIKEPPGRKRGPRPDKKKPGNN